ncbi:MAG: hypothetical protein HPY61_11200 [Methanotrichaceae archaeon]|nr:hypothetical protein [Methanotrichaceae archaeon]
MKEIWIQGLTKLQQSVHAACDFNPLMDANQQLAACGKTISVAEVT